MIQVERINVNVPKEIGDDGIALFKAYLDTEVKLLTYPDCTHPKNSLFCDSCEDTASECNCFGCHIICGACGETVEDKNGHVFEFGHHDDTNKFASFKEILARKKEAILAEIQKILKKKTVAR
jgi:hypothetical protein